jgi:hypothetical protein
MVLFAGIHMRSMASSVCVLSLPKDLHYYCSLDSLTDEIEVM